MKLLNIPKLIGSILNVRACSSIDVSSDLKNEPVSPKSISKLLQDEEEKTNKKNTKDNI